MATSQVGDDWDLSYLDDKNDEFNPMATFDDTHFKRRYASDGRLFIQFHTKAVYNQHASVKQGRPIFQDEDYIKIITPGSQLAIIDAPYNSGNYPRRFGTQFKAWKSGQAGVQSGTPLESFPLLLGKPAMVAELKAINIQTVEQLRELPDLYAGQIMGGNELKRRAAEWMDETQGAAAVMARMGQENEQLRAQMNEMQRQLAELLAQKAAPQQSARK